MDKAQLERITELTKLVQGQKTARKPEEILAAEKAAGAKYIARPAPAKSGIAPPGE